jgi:hypothetical protein
MMQVQSLPITGSRRISAGDMEAGVWGKTSDGRSAKAQESSVGEYDQMELSELTAWNRVWSGRWRRQHAQGH